MAFQGPLGPGLVSVRARNGVTQGGEALRTNGQWAELRCWGLNSASSLEQPFLFLTPGRVRGEA